MGLFNRRRNSTPFQLDAALKHGERLPAGLSIAYQAPMSSVSVAAAQSDFDFIDGQWIDVRAMPDISRLIPETVLRITNVEVNYRGALRLRDGTTLAGSLFNARPDDWGRTDFYKPERIREAYASIVQGAAGYGHWLINRLSRLVTLRDFDPSLPLVSSQLPHDGHDFLSRIGYDPREVRLLPREEKRLWRVDEMFVSSYAGVNGGRVADATRFRRDIHRLVAGIQLAGGTSDYPSKLFFARRPDSSSRQGLSNGAELEQVFVDRGFTSVDVASLPFEEQVRMIRAADIMAGEGGSFAQSAMLGKRDLTLVVVNANSGPGATPYSPGNKTYARMVTDAFGQNLRRIVASQNKRGPGWSADLDVVQRALDSMPE